MIFVCLNKGKEKRNDGIVKNDLPVCRRQKRPMASRMRWTSRDRLDQAAAAP